jgi:L-galactono-1,4-lactone dehydrogenase
MYVLLQHANLFRHLGMRMCAQSTVLHAVSLPPAVTFWPEVYSAYVLLQVTVQAGCRVQQVADYLKPYGLTLQNYASIREQQIGGYTQVSAHGTGAAIPPVDEQVVSMKVVTPGKGTLTLSRAQQPALFDLARVGLGALGVVTEMTLQCVPLHHLVERSFVASSAEVERNHTK